MASLSPCPFPQIIFRKFLKKALGSPGSRPCAQERLSSCLEVTTEGRAQEEAQPTSLILVTTLVLTTNRHLQRLALPRVEAIRRAHPVRVQVAAIPRPGKIVLLMDYEWYISSAQTVRHHTNVGAIAGKPQHWVFPD